jgi:uncharacterized protein involved in exopolysaccharide biosynthesis
MLVWNDSVSRRRDMSLSYGAEHISAKTLRAAGLATRGNMRVET